MKICPVKHKNALKLGKKKENLLNEPAFLIQPKNYPNLAPINQTKSLILGPKKKKAFQLNQT